MTQHALNIRCLCQLVDHLCKYFRQLHRKISEVENEDEKIFRKNLFAYQKSDDVEGEKEMRRC